MDAVKVARKVPRGAQVEAARCEGHPTRIHPWQKARGVFEIRSACKAPPRR